MNGAASGSAIIATDSATVAMRTAKTFCEATGEARIEIEIGARIEGARHRLHRLRHHQQPRQQHGDGDADQHVLGRAAPAAKEPTTE